MELVKHSDQMNLEGICWLGEYFPLVSTSFEVLLLNK